MRAPAVLGIFLVAFLACPAAAQQTIKIGIAVPLSGALASVGTPLVTGAQRAVETINSAGGISGRQIELTMFDDGGDPARARSIAQRIVAENIKFVIGHASSATSLATADVYAQARVLQIEPRGGPQSPTAPSGWTALRICGPDAQRGAVLAAYLQKQLNVTRVGFVHEDNGYSRAMIDRLKLGIAPGNLTIDATEGASTRDGIVNAIGKVRGNSNAAVVVNVTSMDKIDFRALGSLMPNARIFVDWTMNEPIIPANLPDAKGKLIIQEIDQTVGKQLPASLSQIRAQGAVAANSALFAFAAVQVIAEGIRHANSDDAQRVSQHIRAGQQIPTILGDLKFNVAGHTGFPRFAVYGIGVGKYRPDGTEVSCDKGCQCKDGGCSEDCCSK